MSTIKTDIDFGFVILCPERNLGGLIATVRSAKKFFPKASCLCVLPRDATRQEIAEFAERCDVVRGKDTYTSLINLGIRKSEKDWNFVVLAGSVFKSRFYQRYATFLKDERDILFPIINFKCNFVDATINGILIHKSALVTVGEFEEMDLDHAKLHWALRAIDRGFRFKAIAGARVF